VKLRPAFWLSIGLACLGCALPADEGTSADDVSSTSAMVTLIQSSKTVVYGNITSTASKSLSSALITAAHAGVEVHVFLKEGSHDTTWLLQQSLESNGVDCDVVVKSPVSTITMVNDDTVLVGTRRYTTASTVAKDRKRFAAAFAGQEPAKGSLLSSGVRVWAMPDSSRDRVVQIFEAARSSIDLSVYALQERRVVLALKDAAGRGVKVRVMLEPRTVGGSNEATMADELGKAGVTVQATPPAFDTHRNVDHAKFAVIDGKELLFGTGNLVRSGLGGEDDDVYANRDFWVEDARAKTIAEAQKLFDADWARSATSASMVSDLVVTPDNADDSIGAVIDGAQKRLYVYNQSLSDKDFVARILAAKQRGADVRVLLGYQPAFGNGAPPNAGVIDQLKAAGIDAGYLQKHYLHAKAIVADGEVYLGSQNFTSGGLVKNRELGEVLTDAAAIETVVSTFESDAAN
jgi:cardiolipin synthase